MTNTHTNNNPTSGRAAVVNVLTLIKLNRSSKSYNTMFSDFYFFIFGSVLSLAYTVGVTPINWDPINRKVFVPQNPYLRWKTYGVFSAFVAHALFSLIQVWRYKTASMKELSYLSIFFSFQIMIFVAISLTIFQPHKVMSSINCLINYLRKYAVKWLPPQLDPFTQRMCFILDRLIILTGPVLILSPIFMSLHVLFFPETPIYVTSLFPTKWLNNFVVLPFVFIYHTGFVGTFAIFGLHFEIVLAYIFLLTPILWKDLRANLPKYRTFPNIHHCPNLIHEYRSVEIMHCIGMEFYGPLVLPFHSVLWLFVVLGLCIITKHWRDLDYIEIHIVGSTAVSFFLFWAMALQFGGFYFNQGLKTIKSWKHFKWSKENMLYLKKFARSCRPLKIGDQARFKFNNLSILFFIRGITRGIVRALLAT